MNFLNYENPVVQNVRKLVDFVYLGILWFLSSIPIFTFGAATTAMHYTAEYCIHKDEGSVTATFFRSFLREFKQATVLWLISLPVIFLLGLNALILWRIPLNGAVYALLLAVLLLGIGWLLLWYAYLSKIEDKIGVLLVNTFRIALGNVPKLIVLELIGVAAFAVAVFAFFHCFPILVLVPGFYAGLTGMMLRNIFKKYLPQEEESQQ